jgi:hypothetical protein
MGFCAPLAFSLALVVGCGAPTFGQGVAEVRLSAADAPMTQDEVLARVRQAYAKNQDVDDVAADVDRRGVNFAMDNTFANRIRFLRGAIVTNALWRADDRRKAISAKPTKPTPVKASDGDGMIDANRPFIEQVRVATKSYLSGLPDFTVRQQVQRYSKLGAARWQLGDYLEIAIAYSAERGEKLELKQQNGSSTSVKLDQIGGLTSSGQFAGQLAALFDPESQAEFREDGTRDFFGQPVRVYSFIVPTKTSRQQLRTGKAQITTGYRGRLFINPENRQILRLESECIDIPSDFPISEAVSIVEFGWVAIGGNDFFLPVSARVALTDRREKVTSLNCISFYKYGKFETDITIID